MTHPGLSVVFVHGVLSSPATWSKFLDLLRSDPDLAGLDLHPFGYASPAVSVRPDRQIPTLDDIADSLWTYLTHDLADHRRLVLVTHSQGGLVVQRMLARVLADGRGRELARIRRIVMFACPNSGSKFLWLLRRWLSRLSRLLGLRRNPQEEELHPLHPAVQEAQRRVLTQVVHAQEVGPDRCPIRIVAYAGERDGVVQPTVARGFFPDAGTLPGDHSSIIQPDSHSHRSYVALRRHLREVRDEPPASRAPQASAEEAVDGMGTDSHHGAAEQDHRVVDRAEASQPSRAPAEEPRADAPTSGRPSDGDVVDCLLAVPGMRERAFRDRLYDQLPEQVQDQLPRYEEPRLEIFGLVGTLDSFRHISAWGALLRALDALRPGHPTIDRLRRVLDRRGG